MVRRRFPPRLGPPCTRARSRRSRGASRRAPRTRASDLLRTSLESPAVALADLSDHIHLAFPRPKVLTTGGRTSMPCGMSCRSPIPTSSRCAYRRSGSARGRFCDRRPCRGTSGRERRKARHQLDEPPAAIEEVAVLDVEDVEVVGEHSVDVEARRRSLGSRAERRTRASPSPRSRLHCFDPACCASRRRSLETSPATPHRGDERTRSTPRSRSACSMKSGHQLRHAGVALFSGPV